MWIPFAPEDVSDETIMLLRGASRLHRAGRATRGPAQVSPPIRLCEIGVAPTSRALGALAHGHHLDADALTQLARDVAAGLGIRQLFGLVGAVHLDAAGDIRGVDIGGGRTVRADLYIDATTSGTIAAGMGNTWSGFADLLYDRLVGLPLPREAAAPCFSLAAAADAGYIWRLPLPHRTALGYCYSSAHVSDDEATETVIAASGLSRRRTADPRRLAFLPGRRAQIWRGNCLAVGAAACRLDPVLASEALVLQRGLEVWCATMEQGEAAVSERRASYNARMDVAMDAAHDAARLPFFLSTRRGSFWDDARAAVVPASLARRLETYDRLGVAGGGASSSDVCLLGAAGCYPRTFASLDASGDLADIERVFERGIATTDELIATWQAAT